MAAGVTSVLNFAPLVLNVPEGVDVRKVDLSIELQILAFHAQRRSAAKPESPAARGTNPASANGLHQAGPRPPVTPELAAQA